MTQIQVEKMSRRQKQQESWEKTRSRGLLRFIIEIAILRFALPCVVISQIALFIWNNGPEIWEHGLSIYVLAKSFDPLYILIQILIIPVTGVGFGLAVWFWRERERRNRFDSIDSKNQSGGF